MAPRLTVSRIDFDAPHRSLLTDATNITMEKRASDVGTGSFTISNSSAQRWSMNTDVPLVFSIDDVETYTAVVTSYDQTTVAEGEEAEEVTTFTVSAIIDEWRRAVVFPPLPPGVLPAGDTVYFDFSHIALDETGWTSGYARFWQCNLAALFRESSAPPSGLWGAPESWPDPKGQWMAPRPLSGDRDPVGEWYARRWFTVEEENMEPGQEFAELVIYAAADDAFDLRLDGMPIIGWDDPPGNEGWSKGRFVRLKVSPGLHLLAVKVKNYDRADLGRSNYGNISVFLCAVYQVMNTWLGRTQVKLFGSGAYFDPFGEGNDGWIVLDYPAQPPGFTPLRVIELLLGQAQARGALPHWHTNWASGGVTDTDGTVAPKSPDFSFRVGMTYLDVLRQMTEGYIEFDAHIRPNEIARRLSVWIAKDTTYPGRGSTRPMTIELGDNATSIEHSQTVDSAVTKFLVLYDRGYFMHQPEPMISDPVGLGRRESFLSLADTKDRHMAMKTADAHLLKFNHAERSTVASYYPATPAESPPTAFDLGDTIQTRNSVTVLQSYRVQAIAAAEPEEGKLLITPELGTAQQEHERAIDRWLTRTGPGMFGGRSEATNPAVIRAAEVQTIQKQTFTWEQSGDAKLHVGVPWLGKKPVKVVRAWISADEATGGFLSERTIVRIMKDDGAGYVLVIDLELWGDHELHVECLEAYGTIGTKWNAEIIQASAFHKRIGVECEYIEIG